MQFYFIRHGQSENNLLWALTGSWEGRSEDPGLTPLGRKQAGKLARFLAQPGRLPTSPGRLYDPLNVGGFGLTHLYCSLMVRAVATGTVVARALDLPLVAWEDAHEVGGINRLDTESGERIGMPGPNRAFFETHYPGLLLPGDLGEEGWWNRPSEPREQRPVRARRFLDTLIARHGGTTDRVAVISHGGFHNQLLKVILNMPDTRSLWFALVNAGITRIDFDQDDTVLQYTNRVDFMPRDWIT